MQAAADILVKSGWERFTTNSIAERAGVNIGSLYQFFPNKEAIAAELQLRHSAQSRKKLVDALSRLSSQRSLREALSLLVGAIVAEHRIAPAVHRAIAEELPKSFKLPPEDEEAVDAQVLSALLPFMTNVPDPHFAARVARITAHAVIHEAAASKMDMLNRPDFVEEVVSLLEPYLQRPAPSKP